jgi:hypothetical protein
VNNVEQTVHLIVVASQIHFISCLEKVVLDVFHMVLVITSSTTEKVVIC